MKQFAGLLSILLATGSLASQQPPEGTLTPQQSSEQSIRETRLNIAKRYLVRILGKDAPQEIDQNSKTTISSSFRTWATPTPVVPLVTAQELMPNLAQRYARMHQIQLDWEENPKQIYAATTADPNNKAWRDNPSRSSRKLTLSLNLNELFPKASEVTALFGAKFPLSGRDAICPDTELLRCMTRTRPRDSWGRILSAITLTGGVVERKKLVDGVLPDPSNPIYNRKEFIEFVGGSFDPATLFVSGTDWKDAVEAVNSYKGKDAAEFWKKHGYHCVDPLSKDVLSCAYGPNRFFRALAVLMPTAQVKNSAQFDYKYVSPEFILPDRRDKGLYTWSLTWNARRAWALKDRIAIVTAATTTPPTSNCLTTKNEVAEELIADYVRIADDQTILSSDAFWAQFRQSLNDALCK
jgi:hypothetical protein